MVLSPPYSQSHTPYPQTSGFAVPSRHFTYAQSPVLNDLSRIGQVQQFPYMQNYQYSPMYQPSPALYASPIASPLVSQCSIFNYVSLAPQIPQFPQLQYLPNIQQMRSVQLEQPAIPTLYSRAPESFMQPINKVPEEHLPENLGSKAKKTVLHKLNLDLIKN